MFRSSFVKSVRVVYLPARRPFHRAFSTTNQKNSDLDKEIQNQINQDKDFFFPSLQKSSTEIGVEKKEEASIELVRRVQINDGLLKNPEPVKG